LITGALAKTIAFSAGLADVGGLQGEGDVFRNSIGIAAACDLCDDAIRLIRPHRPAFGKINWAALHQMSHHHKESQAFKHALIYRQGRAFSIGF
jgi:hypothetical protein